MLYKQFISRVAMPLTGTVSQPNEQVAVLHCCIQ